MKKSRYFSRWNFAEGDMTEEQPQGSVEELVEAETAETAEPAAEPMLAIEEQPVQESIMLPSITSDDYVINGLSDAVNFVVNDANAMKLVMEFLVSLCGAEKAAHEMINHLDEEQLAQLDEAIESYFDSKEGLSEEEKATEKAYVKTWLRTKVAVAQNFSSIRYAEDVANLRKIKHSMRRYYSACRKNFGLINGAKGIYNDAVMGVAKVLNKPKQYQQLRQVEKYKNVLQKDINDYKPMKGVAIRAWGDKLKQESEIAKLTHQRDQAGLKDRILDHLDGGDRKRILTNQIEDAKKLLEADKKVIADDVNAWEVFRQRDAQIKKLHDLAFLPSDRTKTAAKVLVDLGLVSPLIIAGGTLIDAKMETAKEVAKLKISVAPMIDYALCDKINELAGDALMSDDLLDAMLLDLVLDENNPKFDLNAEIPEDVLKFYADKLNEKLANFLEVKLAEGKEPEVQALPESTAEFSCKKDFSVKKKRSNPFGIYNFADEDEESEEAPADENEEPSDDMSDEEAMDDSSMEFDDEGLDEANDSEDSEEDSEEEADEELPEEDEEYDMSNDEVGYDEEEHEDELTESHEEAPAAPAVVAPRGEDIQIPHSNDQVMGSSISDESMRQSADADAFDSKPGELTLSAANAGEAMAMQNEMATLRGISSTESNFSRKQQMSAGKNSSLLSLLGDRYIR
ncbi:MAG: hypothetical protein MJZ34_02810 [Paludibacteraceae bacterium]|nr:hypothetical protein [Paludibacteraceae bacterium]